MISRSKFQPALSILTLLSLLAGCNLQQAPLIPTPTLMPTPTAFDQPTRTAINPPVPTALSVTLPPPLPTTPTSLPLNTPTGGVSSAGSTIIPTVSTLEAVRSATLQANAGDTVGLTYSVSMNTGSLTLTMQGTAGALWQKTFTTSETGRVEIVIPQSGDYAVMAHTDRFDGSYQLNWN